MYGSQSAPANGYGLPKPVWIQRSLASIDSRLTLPKFNTHIKKLHLSHSLGISRQQLWQLTFALLLTQQEIHSSDVIILPLKQHNVHAFSNTHSVLVRHVLVQVMLLKRNLSGPLKSLIFIFLCITILYTYTLETKK